MTLLQPNDLQLNKKEFTSKMLKLYINRSITKEQMKAAQEWYNRNYRKTSLSPDQIEKYMNKPLVKDIPIVDNLTLDL